MHLYVCNQVLHNFFYCSKQRAIQHLIINNMGRRFEPAQMYIVTYIPFAKKQPCGIGYLIATDQFKFFSSVFLFSFNKTGIYCFETFAVK